MNRDLQLDAYRALAIIFIVCVVHVTYWLGIGEEPVLSLLLFEMPVIFFIAGASQAVSRKQRTLLHTIKSRCKRVVLPYYIYAVLMLAMLSVLTMLSVWLFPYVSRFATDSQHAAFDITAYTCNDVLDVVLFQGIAQLPLGSHLWFIAPYLLLSLLFAVEQRLLCRLPAWVDVLLSILLFVVTSLLCDDYLLHTLAAYNIFMVAGYCCYGRTSRRMVLLLLPIAAAALAGLWLIGYDFAPMQSNKFPPNAMFVAYGLLAIMVLSLVFGRIRIPQCRMVDTFNRHGFSIYLYQNIVFYAVVAAHKVVIGRVPFTLVQFVLCALLALVLSYAMGNIIGWMERMAGKLWLMVQRLLANDAVNHFLKFCIVGVVATAIHYGIYYILLNIINVSIAYSIGFVVSFVCNYFMNVRFTFGVESSRKRFGGFAMSHAVNYVVQIVALQLWLWVGVPAELAPIPVYCVSVPICFLLVKHFLNDNKQI